MSYYKKTIPVHSTIDVTEETISDLLSLMLEGGIGYWGDIGFNEDDYKAAKARLLERGIKPDSLCYEEVLAEILIGGGKLDFLDCEEDEHYPCDLAKLEEAISDTILEYGSDLDDWDAYAGDYLGQMICFGEVIYG